MTEAGALSTSWMCSEETGGWWREKGGAREAGCARGWVSRVWELSLSERKANMMINKYKIPSTSLGKGERIRVFPCTRLIFLSLHYRNPSRQCQIKSTEAAKRH